MADQSHQSDAMIERLERELEERTAFIQGTVGAAQDRKGDISDNESELLRMPADLAQR